jgi:3-oxoadipate enol-lactonase
VSVLVQTGRGTFGATAHGSGAPVVLCHSLAMSGRMWERSVAHLADRYEVWAVDARGHGDSPWDGQPFTVGDMADDLAAVLDALSLPRVHLFGLSMGGSTALTFAASYPDRVISLVLADTTACYGPKRIEAWQERAATAAASTRHELLPFQLERWFSPGFLASHGDIVTEISDVFRSTDPLVHAAACGALGQLDAESELDKIGAETLILVGSEDFATPPPMARTLAERIPRSTLLELAGLRHMSVIEDSKLWALAAAHMSAQAPTVRA